MQNVLRLLALLPFLSSLAPCQDASNQPPNIVFIVADDLGYGDLGCFGQKTIRTPHIDRLAQEGRRYTQFYSGSTVCAPSRCALMSGLHTGHCLIRGNRKQSLRPEDITIGEILKTSRYSTAAIGKWGLGNEGSDGVPTKQGFDTFFGYLDQSHAHNYYPTYLIRDQERVALRNVVPKEGKNGQGKASEKIDYSHDLITEEALTFVRANASEPFFLYLAWTIPHANNEAGKEGMEVPDEAPYATKDWPAPQRGLAAMITRMDRDVGRLLALLDELDIAQRTAVFFTSDNGPHREGGNKPDFFDSNGPLRGIKRSLTEGGIRVPLIVRWPGRIEANTTSDHIAAFWDVLPTLAELAGASEHVPSGLDGISFAPDLFGLRDQEQHEQLYWAFYEGGGAQALRRGNWKAVQQPIQTAIRLYDLSSDLGEQNDLAQKHPDVVQDLERRMNAEYRPSPEWSFPKPK